MVIVKSKSEALDHLLVMNSGLRVLHIMSTMKKVLCAGMMHVVRNPHDPSSAVMSARLGRALSAKNIVYLAPEVRVKTTRRVTISQRLMLNNVQLKLKSSVFMA
jgi:hypothetical protein